MAVYEDSGDTARCKQRAWARPGCAMRGRHVEHVQASHYTMESQAGVTATDRAAECTEAQAAVRMLSGFLHFRSSLWNSKPAVKCARMRVTKLEILVGKSSPLVGSKWASEMPAAKTKHRQSIVGQSCCGDAGKCSGPQRCLQPRQNHSQSISSQGLLGNRWQPQHGMLQHAFSSMQMAKADMHGCTLCVQALPHPVYCTALHKQAAQGLYSSQQLKEQARRWFTTLH